MKCQNLVLQRFSGTEIYFCKLEVSFPIQQHNNFLLELKKIPFYEIRKSLLDNYSLFFKLYKDDPSIIEKYSQISTIVNRIIMMIIKDLLNLPDTAVDDTFDKMYSDLSNQLLNNCHIDCIPTEMSTSKTKTLQAIVKLETKLLT